jgi:hypothetical protein
MKKRLGWVVPGFAFLSVLLLAAGCESGGGDSGAAGPTTGPQGQSVTVVGLQEGAMMACRPVQPDVWAFSVSFAVSRIDRPCTAQLLVEVDKDANGQEVWGSNRGPYVQAGARKVAPASAGGLLDGRIGPPVSPDVRFSVSVRLVDAQGVVIASSQTVAGLRPVVE